VHLYLIRGLIFDGYPGFVWAMVSAFSPTVRYMKLRELQWQAGRAAQPLLVSDSDAQAA
jgi:hypothetical protein